MSASSNKFFFAPTSTTANTISASSIGIADLTGTSYHWLDEKIEHVPVEAKPDSETLDLFIEARKKGRLWRADPSVGF